MDGLVAGSDGFALCIGKVKQIIVIICDFKIIGYALIDIQCLRNQADTNNIHLINLKKFIAFIFGSSSADAYDIFGSERINDRPCFGCIIGMLLINNDNELHAAAVRFRNTVKQVFAFTVTDSRIAFLRDKFPIDESCAAWCKAVLHGVK